MGRVWGADTVAYNTSTSFYGNIVALAESPVKEGLIYAGTDDGLIQVTEDGGAQLAQDRAASPACPDDTYVSDVEPSPTDANTVYASFNNHQMGDFKPYLLKSTDRGATWTVDRRRPAGARLGVDAWSQDFQNPNLLFAGTEFGLYFTIDGGKKWIQLSSLPVIPVRDLAIHKRENDLAVATFGRGFYILDDFTPLRQVQAETLEQDAALFPVKKAAMYMEAAPLGLPRPGLPGRLLLHRPQPAVRRRLHLLPEGGPEDPQKLRQEAEKKLAEGGRRGASPDLGDAARPRIASRSRRSSSPSRTRKATWCAG